MEITTERVTMQVDGSPMGGFLARPTTGGPYPGILVFMEIFGVNSHIRDVTQRVAREGYVALAIDYYHRTAPGMELGYTQEDIEKGFAQAKQTTTEGLLADIKAGIDYLKSRKDVRGDRIGCIGFCFGGYVAYLAATLPDIKATASFYGGGIAAPPTPGGRPPIVDRTKDIKGFILCLFGTQDTSIPLDQVDKIENELKKHNIRHKVLRYDAGHGFFCDQRASYHAPSAQAAWEEVKAMFDRELRKS
ncbi:MAG TPA: dienelactone hydrolase family protein [Candidatus Limnocylindrales bacterium]|jgi:carboxymethylenebutenolidase|nr:dienelactone hydrolase family protein [Candidatus Limnocylindrales bacterium]